MKANELMIGDWVKISHLNKIGKVYRIDRANGEGNGFAAVIDGDYNEKNLEPIPLQKIHLIKNGFEADEDDYVFTFNDGYEIRVTYVDDFVEQGVEPYFFLNINFAEKALGMEVEYVHQLQHAMQLMGCDKTIEL